VEIAATTAMGLGFRGWVEIAATTAMGLGFRVWVEIAATTAMGGSSIVNACFCATRMRLTLRKRGGTCRGFTAR